MNKILTFDDIVNEAKILYEKHFPDEAPLTEEDADRIAKYLVGRPSK